MEIVQLNNNPDRVRGFALGIRKNMDRLFTLRDLHNQHISDYAKTNFKLTLTMDNV